MKKKLFTIMMLVIAVTVLISACGAGAGGNVGIAIGPAASETNSVTKLILEAYGIEEGDYREFQEGFGDAADGVRDGNIDISFGILGLPNASIVDLHNAVGDVKMLGLSDEVIQHMEENTGYRKYIIPAGSYDFLEEDVQTITAYAIMVASTDTVDDELAYELARVMVEHAEENTHAQSDSMTLENALSGLEGLPIHPGAKRYYEEQGLTVDAPEATVSASASDRKAEMTLGTGTQGGTYYPLGGEIANLWNQYVDGVNVTNTETGASVENLASIRQGTLDLGMTVHVPALQAFEGTGEFDGSPVENFAFIGHVYPEIIQIITREASGIDSLDDLVN